MGVTLRRVGAEAAADVHAVVRAAFSGRPPLDPPTAALAETPQTLAEKLAAGGGLIADVDGAPAGALLLDPLGDLLFLRRFGVVPGAQHHGLGHRMVEEAVELARQQGRRGLAVLAREELPATVGFWRDAGFVETGREPPYRELVRWLPQRHDAADADAMREVGRAVAVTLRAGDLLVLTGELGAGKTTFTQGLAEGLGVRGQVTSPTFVIARVHPSLVGGPSLVHVDAYRLGGGDELDDLDLDTSLDEAVTVVEWGEGLAEALATDRLEVRITRALGDDGGVEDHDPRVVEVLPVGARWRG
ncbi:tRNA (adenosine(37)-N6)-threonylcarbamoyltransferase complex ATPase subunit type 1 TsaE [Nocardioides limicola]|uniref:tRNA (adenosine(37)-N6)-threonylcarbamoyltransferase complex ATPase subunit type 1 TsaE n=1 Tax=Nocardioides limicola TaxID=2803368 RepID=UPI00193C351B|nr:tRNA (adenosine(37)-N6)-threonylcarbamoyltransferase complex ATPase subunit type 1 TsaE [Nocardioides sp. DJM-14]